METAHQPGAFKLGQNTIDCRQSNLFVMTQEFLVDILGSQMPFSTPFENPKNLDPRDSDLESGLFDLLVFQCSLPRHVRKRPSLAKSRPCCHSTCDQESKLLYDDAV